MLDPLQEASFKAHARRLEARCQRFRREWRGIFLALRRTLRQVGEKQLSRAGSALPARHGHCTVRHEKLQRLIGVPSHQVIEIAAQRGKAALRRGDGGADVRRSGLGQRGEQLLDRIGELRDAIQADNGQRTVGLMHAGACLFQPVSRRIGDVVSETLSGAFQCKVDFSLDPGQRSDVEIHAHEKLFATPWFMCPLFTP